MSNHDLDESKMTSALEEAHLLASFNMYEPIISRRKILGPFIVFLRKIIRRLTRWDVLSLTDQQQRFNKAVLRVMNNFDSKVNIIQESLREHETRINSLSTLQELLRDHESRINSLSTLQELLREHETRINLLSTLQESLREHEMRINSLSTLQESLKEHETRINSLSTLQESLREHETRINFLSTLEESIRELEMRISPLNALQKSLREHELRIDTLFDKISNESIFLSSRIRRVERKREHPQEYEETYDMYSPSNKPPVDSGEYDFDYLMFEHIYRGTENEIKKRQAIYLEYFVQKQNILDIGCGRGEFLELLTDHGIKTKGIDINIDSIALCEDKGLDVKCIDALTYLTSVGDGSLGGVMLAQVVEHLDMPYLLELLNLIFKKMEKGACIILESPNPRTLAIFRNSFYLDPGHVKPIHPELLKFIVTSIGFRDAQEKTYTYSKDGYDLPLIEGDGITNVDEFNSGIRVLNEVLFGKQDYTIVAYK